MHVREAKQFDAYAMGSTMCTCNRIDTLTRYFIKNTDKYPTTYLKSGVRLLKRRTTVPGSVTLVAETQSSDYNTSEQYRAPEVVGFIVYKRIGTSVKALQWQMTNSGLSNKFNAFLNGLEDRYLRAFPSVDCTRQNGLFQKLLPFLAVPFDEEVFAEAWEIDLFFVHPEWQRKGMGRKLLQWGFDRATEEGVPVIVKSSALGGASYRACGFRSMGEIGLDGLFDTKEYGGEEPQLWCWEPEACRGQWFERGKDAFEKTMERRRKAKNLVARNQ